MSILQEILDEMNSDWEAVDDDGLITCCGHPAELDIPHCPGCGAKNPIREAGMI